MSEIKIKENGNLELPLFPLDGMVTRHINLVYKDKIYENASASANIAF